MKIALAQINPTVGDLEGNVDKIITNMDKAKAQNAKLVIFSELATTGYPPLDLLNKNQFLKDNKDALERIIAHSKDMYVIVGFVDYDASGKVGNGKVKKYNSAAFIGNGKLIGIQNKTLLPTYDVFAEMRYFEPTTVHNIFNINGVKVGIQICEDLWDENYKIKVTEILAKKSDFIVNISASPFEYGKRYVRKNLLTEKARKNNIPIFYVNQVGGQDDLVFDGESMVVDKTGALIAVGGKFEEDLIMVDFDLKTREGKTIQLPSFNDVQEIQDALVLGVRDYFWKKDFEKAVIALSGGIDSAVTAAIAVEALGKENVIGVSMPSPYSSQGSLDDAKELAENLGIRLDVKPIGPIFDIYKKTLSDTFKGMEDDVTEENLQARIRGDIIMAYSNKFGQLVLATGNKSELAVGYCTLYGDMCGGFSVLSDVLKTKVYQLANYINRNKIIIPQNTINKPPSAELKPGQVDQDTLPEYEVLDGILKAYIEEGKDTKDIVKLGFSKEIVSWVINKVDGAEFKRRQATPGIKITEKAFGTGRQMPITNRYRG